MCDMPHDREIQGERYVITCPDGSTVTVDLCREHRKILAPVIKAGVKKKPKSAVATLEDIEAAKKALRRSRGKQS